MYDIEFKIYTRNKRWHISPNAIVYTLVITLSGILFLSIKYLDNIIVTKIAVRGLFGTGLLMAYFSIAQYFTRKPLNGDLNCSLKFSENAISIASEKYYLKEIQKLEFFICDYFNKWEYPGKGNFNPARTNGTGNSCRITLVNGQKFEVNFQLIQKDEFKGMRELLIKYYHDDKIHFLKLIEYLEIEKYEEIQDFKKALRSV